MPSKTFEVTVASGELLPIEGNNGSMNRARFNLFPLVDLDKEGQNFHGLSNGRVSSFDDALQFPI